MSGPVVAKGPGHRCEVRLGLRLVVERQRAPASDLPPGAEDGPQRLLGGAQRREVAAALRLGDDHLAPEELDGITGAKEARLDQAVILDARPASRPYVRAGHAKSLASPSRPVNVPGGGRVKGGPDARR